MATWEFACSDPIDANVAIAAGTVSVTAAPTDTVTVRIRKSHSGDDDQLADDVSVDYSDQHLLVTELPRRGLGWRGKELHVTIALPAGSRCGVQAASADVTCRGEYGAVDIRTASGRVDVETVRGPAEITTMSGGVQVFEAGSPAVQTASGRIAVRHATGDALARTASGDIRIGSAGASVNAKTASGRVQLLSVARGTADVNSVSGDVDIKVAQNTGVYLDLASVTGRVTSELEPSEQGGGEDLQLHCRTVSGAIRIARAAAGQMAS